MSKTALSFWTRPITAFHILLFMLSRFCFPIIKDESTLKYVFFSLRAERRLSPVAVVYHFVPYLLHRSQALGHLAPAIDQACLLRRYSLMISSSKIPFFFFLSNRGWMDLEVQQSVYHVLVSMTANALNWTVIELLLPVM